MDRRKVSRVPKLSISGKKPVFESSLVRKLKPVLKKAEPVFTVFLWSLVIFYLSGVPGSGLGFKSVAYILIRKIAHVSEYALLTFLAFRALEKLFANKNHAIFGAIFFSVAFALSDEIHQLFISNREGRSLDIVIDGIGVLIIYFVLKRRNRF